MKFLILHTICYTCKLPKNHWFSLIKRASIYENYDCFKFQDVTPADADNRCCINSCFNLLLNNFIFIDRGPFNRKESTIIIGGLASATTLFVKSDAGTEKSHLDFRPHLLEQPTNFVLFSLLSYQMKSKSYGKWASNSSDFLSRQKYFHNHIGEKAFKNQFFTSTTKTWTCSL